VDEVVGDLDILTRACQALRVSDVADVEVKTRCLQYVGFRAIANQAPDQRLRVCE